MIVSCLCAWSYSRCVVVMVLVRGGDVTTTGLVALEEDTRAGRHRGTMGQAGEPLVLLCTVLT
jgi:hypothetical protein